MNWEPVIGLEIHTGIEVRDMLFIAVEHQCRNALGKQPPTDLALRTLGPARMIHLWVHVGVKAVFTRPGHIPAGFGLGIGQRDPHDRLD